MPVRQLTPRAPGPVSWIFRSVRVLTDDHTRLTPGTIVSHNCSYGELPLTSTRTSQDGFARKPCPQDARKVNDSSMDQPPNCQRVAESYWPIFKRRSAGDSFLVDPARG
jgi:hypothetical protein